VKREKKTVAASRTRAPLQPRGRRFRYSNESHSRLTHYLFRYPAKFHPPVARALIEQFSSPGDLVLDPFCGSGTVFVEAMTLNRNCVGVDVDPVAAFIARVKTQRLPGPAIKRSGDRLSRVLLPIRRPDSEYERRQFVDITPDTYRKAVRRYDLSIPKIPNLFHWFRRYVIIDLARIRTAIESLDTPSTHRDFLMLCFASIIRASSNADPVPVSGLEVTSHMKGRDEAGRIINPFTLMEKQLSRMLADMEQFYEATAQTESWTVTRCGDAANLRRHMRRTVDVVITSPPYHNAVDYYRRHTLEMYWLGLTTDHEDRLRLLPKYIGRTTVSQSHPYVRDEQLPAGLARHWESTLEKTSKPRAHAFKHYVISMSRVMDQLAARLHPKSLAVFVLGKNSWNGRQLPTTELFRQMSAKNFRLVDRYWYPVKNRYMSYDRHNDASIDREFVLVLERR